ncbi:hypothetical protein [Nocardia sp. NRRL S-836]|uniref:hypothetical protein n=1 Tax=Nocardia sp. NRRL S-836 TaxID=1519492 RepID=UPI0006AE8ACB|nr:hypothetical protein [Nocardia sp. NRRL S-836]KOV84764.1 hypothetical protein ADL03_15990 [Nocardia sp. NRRL S-836]
MSRVKGGDPNVLVQFVVSVVTAVVVTLILRYVPELHWPWSIVGGLIAGFGGWLAWFMYCHPTNDHGYGTGDRGASLTALIDDLF